MPLRRPARHPQAIDARRWAVAWLAVLALLVQALIPAAAMAYEAGAREGSRTIVICTAGGEKTISVPGDAPRHKGFAGLKCHDCVMASIAAVTPPSPQTAPVRYSQIVRRERAATDHLPDLQRPPPRPPSQGPPTAFDA